MRTLAEVQSEWLTDPETGLSASQALESRRRHGGNHLTPRPREPIWKLLLAKFDEPIIRILLAAALLKIVVDLFGVTAAAGLGGLACIVVIALVSATIAAARPWLSALLFAGAALLVLLSIVLGHPSFDGLAIMIAVALATGVSFAAEYKSDREFELLNSRQESRPVKVRRDSMVHSVPIEDIVVGDLVLLEMGDEVPADGWLVRATELHIDQSLMTGESEPVHKLAHAARHAALGLDAPSSVFRGTQVVDGVGRLVVAAVGDETMLGEIARSLGGASDAAAADRVQARMSVSKELTPLQQKLKKLADAISIVGYCAAVSIFVALMIRGWIDGTIHWPISADDAKSVAGVVLNNFVIMVVIVVVAVPEGLPMSVTISLALAMRKMTQANSLVRQLAACETIGSATVICTDKTGTLTQNRMEVADVVMPGQQPDENVSLPSGRDFRQPASRLDWMVLSCAVNSTAELEMKDGRATVIGNSTEGALLRWLHARQIDYDQLRRAVPPVYQLHFSSERKQMSTVIAVERRSVVLTKGAPELLLAQCGRTLDPSGQFRDWSEGEKLEVESRLAQAAAGAVRTLGFAIGELPYGTPTDEKSLHALRDRLTENSAWLAFVAIRDPLRPEVAHAVAECRAAGIEVIMVTGDVTATARAIAGEIGLLDRTDDCVWTSGEFGERSDSEAAAALPHLRVLARARPLDKFRLVRLLQEQGEVVAMTGDGTNDAPSLKKADVGLSMGVTGTEVAKEASKIVLLDDSFTTIVRAVHWGRALYENIQRFVLFQLTINASALVIAFLAPFLGFGEPPFTVLQLLWINMIMDTLASIGLCAEPPREGLMREPPKRRDESIVTRPMLRTMIVTATFFVVVMIALLLAMKGPVERPGWFAGVGQRSAEFPLFSIRQATIFFTTYVLFQVWNLINCRSLSPRVSGWSGLTRNRAILVIATLIVVGQLLIVQFGGAVFQVEPLRALDWLAIAAGTASVIVVAETLRFLDRRRTAPRAAT